MSIQWGTASPKHGIHSFQDHNPKLFHITREKKKPHDLYSSPLGKDVQEMPHPR